MKILALVTDAFGSPGGIAQYNRDLLTALAILPEISAIKVLPRYGMPDQVPEKIDQLRSRKDKLAYAATGFLKTLQFKPDLLFCGHLNLLPLISIISKLTGVPVWLQLHGIDAWERQKGIAARLA